MYISAYQMRMKVGKERRLVYVLMIEREDNTTWSVSVQNPARGIFGKSIDFREELRPFP